MPALALPAVAIVVIAVLLAMLAYATNQFARAVGHLLPDWHFPGLGSIQGFLNSAAADMRNWVVSTFDASLGALADFILTPITWITALLNTIATTIATAYYTLQKIIGYIIPTAIGALTHLVNYVYAQVIAYADHLAGLLRAAIADAIRVAHAEVTFVQQSLLSFVNYVEAQLVALIAAEIFQVRALVSFVQTNLVSYVDHIAGLLLTQVRTLIAQAVATVELYAVRVTNDAIAAERAAAAVVIGTVWPDLTGAIDGVIDAAAGDFTDVVDELRRIGRAIPKDVATALVGTAAATIAIAKLAKSCTIPQCRNLGGLSNDLHGLDQLLTDGSIMALLALMAAEPEHAATVIHDMFAAPIDELASGFLELVH